MTPTVITGVKQVRANVKRIVGNRKLTWKALRKNFNNAKDNMSRKRILESMMLKSAEEGNWNKARQFGEMINGL